MDRLDAFCADHNFDADQPAKEICSAILQYAVKQDAYLRQIGEEDRLDDKTVFVIKRR